MEQLVDGYEVQKVGTCPFLPPRPNPPWFCAKPRIQDVAADPVVRQGGWVRRVFGSVRGGR
eukprot:8627390-Lingulodinium_polyedra.AAC.1